MRGNMRAMESTALPSVDVATITRIAPLLALAVAIWVGWHAVQNHRLSAAKLRREENERLTKLPAESGLPLITNHAGIPPEVDRAEITLVEILLGMFRGLCQLVGFTVAVAIVVAFFLDGQQLIWHLMGWSIILGLFAAQAGASIYDRNDSAPPKFPNDPVKERRSLFWTRFAGLVLIFGGLVICGVYVWPSDPASH